jgi:hypothetical protein
VSILGVYVIIRRVGRTSSGREPAKEGKDPPGDLAGGEPAEEVGA